MALKKVTLVLVLSIALLGCDLENECANVICAGAPIIGFEVLENGDNVFDSETFTLQDVTLEGTRANDFVLSIVTVLDDDQQETPLLVLENNQWIPQTYDLTLNLGTDVAELQIQIAESESNDCCPGVDFVQSLSVNGNPAPRNEEGGFFILNL